MHSLIHDTVYNDRHRAAMTQPTQPQDDSGSQGAKNACFERIEWSRKALDSSVTQ